MTKKILYSNGDSFVAGMECLGDRDRTEENKQFAFAQHIATALGCETYINNAYNGATNNFIFNNTLFDLLELEKQGQHPQDVFVVIGFTALYRSDIDGNGWIANQPGYDIEIEKHHISFPTELTDHGVIFTNVNSGLFRYNEITNRVHSIQEDINPFCIDYLWTDSVQLPAQEARIIALHEFLKSKGYDHIFVNTCELIKNTKHVDLTCKNFYYPTQTSFFEFGSLNYPDELRECYHFGPLVHEKYAVKLIDYINTQGLIS